MGEPMFKNLLLLWLLAGALACGSQCGEARSGDSRCEDGVRTALEGDAVVRCYPTCEEVPCEAGFECRAVGPNRLCVEAPPEPDTAPEPTCKLKCGERPAECRGYTAVTFAPGRLDERNCRCLWSVATSEDCEREYGLGFCRNGACFQEHVHTPFPVACETFADLQFGSCLTNTCVGFSDEQKAQVEAERFVFLNGGVNAAGEMIASCEDRARDAREMQLRQRLQQVRDGQIMCPTLKGTFCETYGDDACGCMPPVVGNACTMNEECLGGDLTGVCQPEAMDENGAVARPGGQCYAQGCTLGNGTPQEGQAVAGPSTGCGSGGVCYALGVQGGGVAAFCVPNCETNADCDRAVDESGLDGSYACNVIGVFNNGAPFGLCEAACSQANEAVDCPPKDLNGVMVDRICSSQFVCTTVCEVDGDCASAGPGHRCVEDVGRGVKYCEWRES